MHSPFKELKNVHLSRSLSSKKNFKLFMYSYRYTCSCFTDSNDLPLNSINKFLTYESSLEFTNCIIIQFDSIITKLLLFVKAIYFSVWYNTYVLVKLTNFLYSKMTNDYHSLLNYEIFRDFLVNLT